MFKRNDSLGFDMISSDIVRGRDAGEPCYNKFRQLCGLKEAKTFDDFTDQISKNVNTIYSSIGLRVIINFILSYD